MLKKLMLLATAVSALVAFAAPASAQADKLVQAGVPLKVGQTVMLTNESNLVLYNKTGWEVLFSCEKFLNYATVVENGSAVRLEQTGTPPEGGPAYVKGCNYPVTNFDMDISFKGGVSSAQVGFTWAGACNVTAESVPFTFAYGGNKLAVAYSGVPQFQGPCGLMAWEVGKLKMELVNGAAVNIVK